ncbi:MAG: hypothetical protein ACKOHI_07530, partial [Phycisphaerales bacterium]
AVPLVPQAREPFSWLASQVYRHLHDGAPLPALLGMLAHEGLTTQSLPPQDARIQAILWTLWQLGLTGLTVEGEGADRKVTWERGTHPGINGTPVADCFSAEAIADGRAMAAALVVAGSRAMHINGTDVKVHINNLELVKAQAAEVAKRQADPSHDPCMAASRYVAELMNDGAGPEDLRLRAAIELAADLGVRALFVDTVNRQLRIAAFSREASLTAAFLQGVPAEQFPAVLSRADTLHKAAEDAGRKLAEQMTAAQRAAGGVAAAKTGAAPARPAPPATPVRRRRR